MSALEIATRRYSSLDPLLGLASRWAGAEPERAGSLGRSLLAEPASGARRGGYSQLNNDGCPLEVCLSTTARGVGTRLIVDPAWCLENPVERLAASRRALFERLPELGAQKLEGWCQSLFSQVDEEDEAQMAAFAGGFVWIGAGLEKPGVAVYLDARPFGRETAWDIAGGWLDDVLPDASEARRSIADLRRLGPLASLGFEGTAPGKARAKLYWRLERARPLEAWGVPVLADPIFKRFLVEVVGQRQMPLTGLVLCLGFDSSSGAIADAKIDLCGHCLPRPGGEWSALLDGLTRELGLEPLPGREELRQGLCEVAFLGCGVERGQGPGRGRLNLYLRPPVAPSGPRPGKRRRLLRRAAESAAGAIVDLQQPDGSFEDYRLPVGAATEWVTAYAGLALAEATDLGFANEERRAAASLEAGHWLLTRRAYDEGWGYSATTGADADSTGFALRLLRRLELPTPEPDRQRLLSWWRTGPEAGFATYACDTAWGRVHPCVTAAACLALDDEALDARRTQLRGSLTRFQAADGRWPAYWWRTHHYSSFHHLLLLHRLGWLGDFPLPPHEPGPGASAFELAWTAGIAHVSGRTEASDALLDRLLDRQLWDGRWPGSAELRVTDPSCRAPWIEPAGELYADSRGLLTTASALQVLTRILRDRER